MSEAGARERALYRHRETANEYETVRLRGGGALVHEREVEAIMVLLGDPEGRVLDVACGTGRLLRHFRAHGLDVVGVDASRAMLEEAAHASPGVLVQASADALPFRGDAFAAACAARFFIHVERRELPEFLEEIRRVSGLLVLDTANSSSLKWITVAIGRLGGARAGQSAVWPIARKAFEGAARGAGWRVARIRGAFAVPVAFYRFLPRGLARALLRVDCSTQVHLRSATYWRLERDPGMG